MLTLKVDCVHLALILMGSQHGATSNHTDSLSQHSATSNRTDSQSQHSATNNHSESKSTWCKISNHSDKVNMLHLAIILTVRVNMVQQQA